MMFTIRAIIIVFLVGPQLSFAGESLIVLSCSVSDEWLEKAIEISEKVQPPSKKELVSKLNESKLNNIKLTFHPDDEIVGTGTLLGKEIPYFITDQYVSYITADDEGSQNSILDRYSGVFYLNLGLSIAYECKQSGRKF